MRVGALWLLVFFLTLPGCGARKDIKLSAEGVAALKGATNIQVIHHAPARFDFAAKLPDNTAVIAGGVLFGAVGGVAAELAAGSLATNSEDKIAKKYKLDDPILIIKEKFLTVMKSEMGIDSLHLMDEHTQHQEAAAKFNQGMRLEFRTTFWWLNIFNRLFYEAEGRMVDFRNGKVLWQNWCLYKEESAESTQSFEELFDNDALLLKSKLQKSGEVCATRMINHFLGKSES